MSIFKEISPFGIILLNIIFFITSLILWIKRGKPVLRTNFNFRRILNSIKLDKGLLVLGIGVLFLIITGFILAAFLPVNEPDAVTYHTYRALIWSQKGFIHHFDTNDVRNLVMPVNSELIYTWIFSLTKRDIGFGLLQFFSYIYGIIAFWAFFERFKISYRKRLWAIFIFSSFAGIIAQISSTQSDLFTGVLLLYSIIFFIDFSDKKDDFKGYFSSLAFALALGVKTTAFMAGFALILAFLIYSIRKKECKNFIKFTGFLLVNFLIFSGYNYILNFADFLNPLGSRMAVIKHGFYGGFKGFVANFITYNLQLFDFSGFTWGTILSGLMAKIQNALFNFFRIEQDTGVLLKLEGLNSSLIETQMGYGVVGILTFIPSVLFSAFLFFKNLKSKRFLFYFLGILFYLNLIILSFAIGYMYYSVRFILTFFTLSAPVLIVSYFKRNNFYKTIVVFFALYNLFLISLHLGLRPFNHLLKSYRMENNYKNFIRNVRCMEYSYYAKNTNGCKIAESFLPYIEEYKTAGIFSDRLTMPQHTNLMAQDRRIKIEELLYTRINSYNIEQYDYLITAYPYQDFDVFNKKDEKLYLEGKVFKNCYLVSGKFEERHIIISDKNNIKNASGGFCIIPSEYIASKGFIPVNKVETKWKDLYDNTDKISTYIIWKNNKVKY